MDFLGNDMISSTRRSLFSPTDDDECWAEGTLLGDFCADWGPVSSPTRSDSNSNAERMPALENENEGLISIPSFEDNLPSPDELIELEEDDEYLRSSSKTDLSQRSYAIPPPPSPPSAPSHATLDSPVSMEGVSRRSEQISFEGGVVHHHHHYIVVDHSEFKDIMGLVKSQCASSGFGFDLPFVHTRNTLAPEPVRNTHPVPVPVSLMPQVFEARVGVKREPMQLSVAQTSSSSSSSSCSSVTPLEMISFPSSPPSLSSSSVSSIPVAVPAAIPAPAPATNKRKSYPVKLEVQEGDRVSKKEKLCNKSKPRKIYQCKHCNKSYNGKTAIVRHERTHTGEKPFACKTCGKAFRQKGTLRTHERLHSGEAPLKCDLCQTGFKHYGTLKRHKTTCNGVRMVDQMADVGKRGGTGKQLESQSVCPPAPNSKPREFIIPPHIKQNPFADEQVTPENQFKRDLNVSSSRLSAMHALWNQSQY